MMVKPRAYDIKSGMLVRYEYCDGQPLGYIENAPTVFVTVMTRLNAPE